MAAAASWQRMSKRTPWNCVHTDLQSTWLCAEEVAPAYASSGALEEVGRYAESFPRVKRKGTKSRPAWYVDERLVARLHDQNTVVVRVPLNKRQSLLDTHPDSFGRTTWHGDT